MKLRLQGAGSAPSRRPALMLSPGDGAWCQVDAGRIEGATQREGETTTVVLTGPQPERVGGLLDLRGGAPIDLYATPAVFEHLTEVLPLLPVLQQFCGVHWHLIPVAGEQHSAEFTIERLPQLTFTALTSGDPASVNLAAGERIALAVRDERSQARLFIVHGTSLDGAASPWLLQWMRGADCVVIDRAPHAGSQRWLEALAQLPDTRRMLLDANGCDRAEIARCGVECAAGPIEFEL
jgi:pyrroloquinoline quinone biosynthesis protein B